MNETIIAVGNGGFNLATDLRAANLLPDSRLIVCDTNEKDLKKTLHMQMNLSNLQDFAEK